MRSRSQTRSVSRSQGRSPNVTPLVNGKSMKLPMIGNGYENEPPGTPSVWMQQNSQKNLVQPNQTVGVCSQQGKRPYQEDEYSVRQFLNQSRNDSPETHFFGLFDGHAGGKCSQHVAGNLANVLLEDDDFCTNLPQAIKRSFYACNEQFLKIAEKMKLHDGSTGLVSLIRDNKILVANAGDCRALLVSSGRPIQLSTDHKPTNPEEQKRIASLGGSVVYCMGVARVNRVLAVSRAFGNRTLRTVIRPDAELMQRELVDGDDFLVMASDGLWDVLKNKDVCDVCYSPFLQRKPQQIADELVHLALARGSMDNVTCIVVNLNEIKNQTASNHRPTTSQYAGNAYDHQNGYSENSYPSRGNGNAADTDDNETVDFSHGNNQPRVKTSSSNANLARDGLSKQYSVNTLRGQTDEGAGSGINSEVSESIAIMKKSINSTSSSRLLKAGSTNSISSLMQDGMNGFPHMGIVSSSNNYHSSFQDNQYGNSSSTLTGNLFAPVAQQIPPRSAKSRGGNNNNNHELQQIGHNQAQKSSNLASTFRNSVALNRRVSNNQLLDSGPQPIARASLNDISSMIHDFKTNSDF